jgi:membrane protein
VPEAFAARIQRHVTGLGLGTLTAFGIAYRSVDRTLRDGFIHAGNLAYLSLVTLFPAAILIHAVASWFGRTEAGREAIAQFLSTLPPEVETLVAPVLEDVMGARSGTALLVGAGIALWTTSSFIGTIRDLLRRAHEVEAGRPFWQERLLAIAVTMGAMMLVLLGFFGQLVAQVALSVMVRLVPAFEWMAGWVDISQIAAILILFLSLWALIAVLSPRDVKAMAWPGALVITIVWVGATSLLGPLIASATNFSLTYGAFTGVMVAMLFFYIVGLAIVLGAQLNAALAKRAEIAERVAERVGRQPGGAKVAAEGKGRKCPG